MLTLTFNTFYVSIIVLDIYYLCKYNVTCSNKRKDNELSYGSEACGYNNFKKCGQIQHRAMRFFLGVHKYAYIFLCFRYLFTV